MIMNAKDRKRAEEILNTIIHSKKNPVQTRINYGSKPKNIMGRGFYNYDEQL